MGFLLPGGARLSLPRSHDWGAPLSGSLRAPPRCTSSCDLFIPILPHQGPFGSCFPLFLRDSILPVERPACTPVPLDCAPLGLIWPVSSPSLSSVSSAHSVLRCVRRRLENTSQTRWSLRVNRLALFLSKPSESAPSCLFFLVLPCSLLISISPGSSSTSLLVPSSTPFSGLDRRPLAHQSTLVFF